MSKKYFVSDNGVIYCDNLASVIYDILGTMVTCMVPDRLPNACHSEIPRINGYLPLYDLVWCFVWYVGWHIFVMVPLKQCMDYECVTHNFLVEFVAD